MSAHSLQVDSRTIYDAAWTDPEKLPWRRAARRGCLITLFPFLTGHPAFCALPVTAAWDLGQGAAELWHCPGKGTATIRHELKSGFTSTHPRLELQDLSSPAAGSGHTKRKVPQCCTHPTDQSDSACASAQG